MVENKAKPKAEGLLDFVAEKISEQYRKMDIVNRKPDEIAIILLLSPSTDEAIEMLQAVNLADNTEGSQIEGVSKELSRLSERIQMLLKAI